jgi:hypothetical protein
MNIGTTMDLLRQISPNLENVQVIIDPPGHDGWLIHLRYNTDECVDFSVDKKADVNIDEMRDLICESFVKHLYIL